MMNELRDATFNSGLTFPHSGTAFRAALFLNGFSGDVRMNVAEDIEFILNIVDSDDPVVPPALALMKALRA